MVKSTITTIHRSINKSICYKHYEDNNGGGEEEPYFSIREEIRQGDLSAVQRAVWDGICHPNETASCSHVGGDGSVGNGYTLLHWAAAMTDKEFRSEVGAKKSGGEFGRIVCFLLIKGARAWSIWWQQKDFLHTYGRRTWDMTSDVKIKVILMGSCLDQFQYQLSMRTMRGHGRRGGRGRHGEEMDPCLIGSALCAAAYLNRIDIIRQTIQMGADVDEDSCASGTPLSIAAAKGNLEAVMVLVEEMSASIDHEIDRHGNTALSTAMTAGQVDMVRYLIAVAGANTFIQQSNNMVAGAHIFFCDNDEIVQLVLETMAAQVPSLSNGNRPWDVELAFEVFAGLGCIDGIQLLVDEGVAFPEDILQRAVAFGQKEMLEYLIAEGALNNYNPNVPKVHAYGTSERIHSPKGIIMECQSILDQSIQSKEEFDRLSSRY